MGKIQIKNLAAIGVATMFVILFAACNTNKDNELLELKREVQILKDKREIQDILWRYGLRFDLDRKDEWFKLFADDCKFSTDMPGHLLEFNSLDEIKAFYGRENWLASVGKKSTEEQQQGSKASSSSMSGHVELAGVVKVDGDNAYAVGYQIGSGVRTWRLRRTNGTWLITEMASRRLENKEACREIVPENW